MDLNRGLNKEKPSAKSAIFLHFHLLLKACYQRFWKCKKPVIRRGGDWLFSCSGDRTRTCDLRVMSPTSSQLLHPAMYLSLLYFNLCSGYSPDEHLPKLRDSTSQCIFHCFISIYFRVIRPMSTSRNFGTPPRNVSFIALFQFIRFFNRGLQRYDVFPYLPNQSSNNCCFRLIAPCFSKMHLIPMA